MITNSKEILSQDEKTALRERIQDICKKAVSELMDPTSQMSDEERAQYEQKIFQKLKQGKRLSSAEMNYFCLLYTSPSPRDRQKSRMPSSA